MRTMLLFVGALVTIPANNAQAVETPLIDQRQENQQRRIEQGISSGQLNEREAARLQRQQDRIENLEDRAKADGVVTNRERARIGAAQNRGSRRIFRQKHDRQGQWHR